MIAVIDTSSSVRRACFDVLTETGHSVVVFHSPETFINSGAIYKASLLILGNTRVSRTRSEALLWATSVRPNLRTLLLGLGEILLSQLREAYEVETDETPQADICDYLTEIQHALGIDTSMHSVYPVNTWGVDLGEAQVV